MKALALKITGMMQYHRWHKHCVCISRKIPRKLQGFMLTYLMLHCERLTGNEIASSIIDDWNEAAITARTDKMLKEVMSILSLRGEQ